MDDVLTQLLDGESGCCRMAQRVTFRDVMTQSSPPATERINLLLANCALWGGTAAFLVLLIEQSGTSVPWLGRWIRVAPVLWGVAAIGLAWWGTRLLWSVDHHATSWSPSRPGPRFQSLILYTRQQCPLCDTAHELLSRYRDWLPQVVEVDIDDDPELQRRFDTMVPVVEFDGKIRFRGRISEVLLRRLIEGTPER